MEVVKNKKEGALVDQKLKDFLYRKEVCEYYVEKLNFAISIYNERIEELKKENSAKGNVEKMELEEKIQDLFVEYQNNVKSYDFIKRKIKEMTKDWKINEDEYLNIEQLSKAHAHNSLFSSSEFVPANVEHPKVIEGLLNKIEIISKRIEELELSPKITTSEEIELFDLRLRRQSLSKVAEERQLNYKNVFLPMFNEDMRQYEKYFKVYMNRAKVFANHGVDMVLSEMLKQYQSNKNDKEYEWAFWTALRKLIDILIERLSKNKENLPKSLAKYVEPIKIN